MEHWNCASPDSGIALDINDVCRLLDSIGSASHSALANAILSLVNRHVAMADCTVIRFDSERNPRLVTAASLSDQQRLVDSASHYTRHLFCHDRIQLHLQSLLPQQEIGGISVHRQTLTQIIDAELRRLYGDILGMVDSMAVTIKTGRHTWITAMLCRQREQGALCPDEIATIQQLAPLIASSIARHAQLETEGETEFQDKTSNRIEELCSRLTARERQVICRILDGVTVERIAGDLGLKPTTVITYRTRAYEKLGVSTRRELFSVVLRDRGRPNPRHAANLPVATPHFNWSGNSTHATGTGTDRPHQ